MNSTKLAQIEPELAPLLSEQELAQRHRLELQVERAFYEAGVALRELRDKRLYRDKYKSFEQYCRERFDYSRRKVDYLIGGAQVVENLQVRTNCSQIWPTSESQVRDLITLEPNQQHNVWTQAIEQSGGKVPPARVVKGLVQKLKEKSVAKPPISYKPGDVVMMRTAGDKELKRYNYQWAIITAVNEHSLTVALDKDVTVKPEFVEPVDEQRWKDIKEVRDRINLLLDFAGVDIDLFDKQVLDLMRRRTIVTMRQKNVLDDMEEYYFQRSVKCLNHQKNASSVETPVVAHPTQRSEYLSGR